MNDYYKSIEPIRKELSKLSIAINTIADLKLKSKIEYQKALPLLLRWLSKIENLDAKEDIVRTLSIPWAKPEASKILIAELKKKPKDNLAWAIANGISVTADESILNDLISIAKDKSYGKAREMVVVALGNIKSSSSGKTLIELLKDEEVLGHAIMALGKLKSKQALDKIKDFTNHPKSWIRNEAKKAIKKIEG